MTHTFDEKVDRTGTFSLKWDYPDFFRAIVPNVRLDADTIQMEIADMDFVCAPPIQKALHKAADFPVFGYAHPNADPRYFNSILHWLQKRHLLKVDKESIVYCGSALDGVRQTIRAFSQPGDGIIVCEPVYDNFMDVIHEEERHTVNCPLVNEDEYYTMDWSLFQELCVRKENKVFVLCSPANPVGRVWTADELSKMATICKEHGVVIVSDEIHADFVWKGRRHVPILKATQDNSNLILIMGLNKTFNTMGLHCAYAVIPDQALRKQFCRSYHVLTPTVFTMMATIAGYEEGETWLDDLLVYLESNLDYALDYLHTHLPEVRVRRPEATYFLWADFSAYGFSAGELYRRIGIQGNVFLRSGGPCDPERGQLYLRISVACPRAELEKAMKIICESIRAE